MLILKEVSLRLGGKPILRGLTFDVRAGETIAILGGSGSGKTTILRLMLGLLRPDRGSIQIDGQEIADLPERELPQVRHKMAMVFQGAALFDSLSVRENVGYRHYEQGRLSDQTIEKIVQESLQFVGLEDVMDKMPAELSGGMRKRVGIARAVASGAKVLLLDEPTASLDPINTCLICRLILGLKRKGITQVVVTHDLDSAYKVADRIVMIQKGRLIFEGSPDALRRSHDQAVRQFLDPDSHCATEESLPVADNHMTDEAIRHATRRGETA